MPAKRRKPAAAAAAALSDDDDTATTVAPAAHGDDTNADATATGDGDSDGDGGDGGDGDDDGSDDATVDDDDTKQSTAAAASDNTIHNGAGSGGDDGSGDSDSDDGDDDDDDDDDSGDAGVSNAELDSIVSDISRQLADGLRAYAALPPTVNAIATQTAATSALRAGAVAAASGSMRPPAPRRPIRSSLTGSAPITDMFVKTSAGGYKLAADLPGAATSSSSSAAATAARSGDDLNLISELHRRSGVGAVTVPSLDAKANARVARAAAAAESKSRNGGAANAGSKWFNMQSPAMTPEIEADLKALSQRQYLDSKRFYKREKLKTKLPKHFQIGTIIADHSEHFSARLNRKDRKPHLIQELIDDSAKKAYLKRRFKAVNAAKAHVPKKSAKKHKTK